MVQHIYHILRQFIYFSLFHILYNIRLNLFQSLTSIIGYCEHHLHPVIWETYSINYPVKVNLVNKYLYLFSILIIPCRLIYLYNFLRYRVKNLNSGDPSLTYYYRYGVLLFYHYAVVPGCTSKRCSKCYGGPRYSAQ